MSIQCSNGEDGQSCIAPSKAKCSDIRTQSHRRGLEMKTCRIINERLPHITTVKLDTTKVNGVNFPKRLMDEFKMQTFGVGLSERKLDEMVKEVGFSNAMQGLQVEDIKERVDPQLGTALQSACTPDNKERDETKFLCLMGQIESMNQRAEFINETLGFDDGLAPLFFEPLAFALEDRKGKCCNVPAAVLVDGAFARTHAANMLNKSSFPTLLDFRNILTKQEATLAELDLGFEFITAFIMSTQFEELICQHVQAAILLCLPDENHLFTVEIAVARTKAISEQAVAKIMPNAAATQLDIAREILGAALTNDMPDADAASKDPFYLQVLTCCGLFCTTEQAGKAFSGVDAVSHLMDVVEQRMDDSVQVDIKEFKELQQFESLLKDQQKKTVTEWIKQVLRGMSTPSAAASSASSSESDLPPIRKSKKRNGRTSQYDIMEHFG
eukprot:TRINITY_DN11592_c0_g4_i1.p1 TRINITY_DN11592_c0_g4~~TRINITY_DN11592_c0_g4_i1.p1  ORF type:complete len:441 (-),score=122.02 TRINITY_DN11592_c0_g4_i1:152-1474(-)